MAVLDTIACERDRHTVSHSLSHKQSLKIAFSGERSSGFTRDLHIDLPP